MTNHPCDPTPTVLTGYDSAGVLVGTAEWQPEHEHKPEPGRGAGSYYRLPARWRIMYGQTPEYWCTREQVERELRAAGAVTINEGR